MQKEEAWAQYVKRNPSFATDGARFTAAGLRKFFDVTWDAAHSLGIDNGRAIEARRNAKKTGTPDFIQTLGKMFGGK